MLDPNNFSAPLWDVNVPILGTANPTNIIASQGLLMVAANGYLAQLDQGNQGANLMQYAIRNAGTVLDYQLAMDPTDPFAVYLGVPSVGSGNAVAMRFQILDAQTTDY